MMQLIPSIVPRYLVWKSLWTSLLSTVMMSCATALEQSSRQQWQLSLRKVSHKQGLYNGSEGQHPIRLDGSLEQYIEYAMNHNPELKGWLERSQASIKRISQHRQLPNPSIHYSYYASSIETRVGPQRHRLGIQQTFPWPTKLLASADAAALASKALIFRADAWLLHMHAYIAQLYWSLWSLKESRKMHEDHLSILDALSKSLQASVVTGFTNAADQQQIDLSAARIEDLLLSIDEQIIQTSAKLKTWIGAPHSLEVKISSSPVIREALPNDESKLRNMAIEHPYIKSLQVLGKSSEAKARRENASRFPNFSIGVDWIETGDAFPDVADSGKDSLIIGLSVELPIWQHSYHQSVQAYQAETRGYRFDELSEKNKAITQLEITLSDLRDAKRRVDLFQHTLVPQAQSVFESVSGLVAAGRSSVASMLLAEQDVLELQVGLIKARADLAKAWARLKSITGQTFEGLHDNWWR